MQRPSVQSAGVVVTEAKKALAFPKNPAPFQLAHPPTRSSDSASISRGIRTSLTHSSGGVSSSVTPPPTTDSQPPHPGHRRDQICDSTPDTQHHDDVRRQNDDEPP